MLAEWEDKQPGRVENIFRALGNVAPSHLLDRDLFDFAALAARPDRSHANAQAWLDGSEPARETE
jgi:tRNA 2-thiocytidine biosynthesis protein TtcA